jgi:hypothetical protein
VGRVESVCTDPSAKGQTGPFCLVHLRMLSSFRRLCGRPVRSPLLPCWGQ